ncbi:MAG: nuclear transport factor 2 family protein [Actinobacteria bacterium]|nr:nuclear transport factor 2 family protein [Actinomycetota bacterium]
MTLAEPAVAAAVSPRIYTEIQQFYAHQMQLLDQARTHEWAETFTVDGVFAANAHPEPIRGRDAIRAASTKARAALAEAGLQHRHWLGMLDARTAEGGVVAHSYAVVVETPRGGVPAIRHSTSCVDFLVHDGQRWLVRDRQITRDDLI